MSAHPGLFIVITFVLEGELERKLSVIVLGKQESCVKPRTEGEFVYELLFHQIPRPSSQQIRKKNYIVYFIYITSIQIHNFRYTLHTRDIKCKIEMFLT